MEPNPYESPVMPPPSENADGQDSAIRLLTEIRDHQVEMLTIYRRNAATSRMALLGTLVVAALSIVVALGIFAVKLLALPNF